MNNIKKLNSITDKIIGAAINVHKALGPGLLESAYEACLVFELAENKLKVIQQKPVPVIYKGIRLECGYRLDLLVEDAVVVEIKAIDTILPIHQAQVISYLKLTGCKIGLLINFNVKILKNGIQRIVNNLPE